MFTHSLVPILLFLPSLIIVFSVSFYPIYYAIDISLYETRFLQKVAFVGLEQYTRLIRDPEFLRSVLISLKYALGSLLLTLPIGMIFALLLHRPIRLRSVFRTILILPWTLSQAVTASLWMWILNPQYGPVKYLLGQLGVSQAIFVSNPDWALMILVLVNTWMTYPFPMVLFLAGLQTVPRELYEAGTIDGCSAFSSFWRITLPYIRSTVMSTAIILTLQFFNMVTLIYVMTGGGPLGMTQTLTLRVFLDGFFNFRLAAAAAVGMVIFLLNIVFSLTYIRVLRQAELY
jgi:ABC-type sugar transport system permease subunit